MATLKSETRFAKMIAGSGNQSPQKDSTYAGSSQKREIYEAVSDSSNGTVTVQPPEGDPIEIPTVAPVSSGDEVIVEVQNGKAVAVGAPGWGDAMNVAIEQNADDITAVITSVDGIETMIRAFQGGVLVGKPPTSGTTSVCALVNADGSFDVVNVTWAQVGGKWNPISYTVLSTQDDNGMTVYDGNGVTDENIIAQFGDTILLYPPLNDAGVRASGIPMEITASLGQDSGMIVKQAHLAAGAYELVFSQWFNNGAAVKDNVYLRRGSSQYVKVYRDDTTSRTGVDVFGNVIDIEPNQAALCRGMEIAKTCFIQATGSGATISCAAGVITQIPLTEAVYSSTEFDSYSPYDPMTPQVVSGDGFNAVRIRKAGVYRISAGVYFSTGNTSGDGIYVRRGANLGSYSYAEEVISVIDQEGTGPRSAGTVLVRCAVNDLLYLAARCLGANGTVLSGNKSTYLLVEFVM